MRLLLLFLHLFVSISALFGGGTAILNPVNPMGVNIDVLKSSPFNSFLIPGLILFIVIGLGNILAFGILFKKAKHSLYLSNILGWALIGWITVQCIMMRDIQFLHILYFSTAVLILLISYNLIKKQRKRIFY